MKKCYSFLAGRKNSASEIYRIISRVYEDHFITNDIVHEWWRKFKYGQTDAHDEWGQGCKSVTTNDIIQFNNKLSANK